MSIPFYYAVYSKLFTNSSTLIWRIFESVEPKDGIPRICHLHTFSLCNCSHLFFELQYV